MCALYVLCGFNVGQVERQGFTCLKTKQTWLNKYSAVREEHLQELKYSLHMWMIKSINWLSAGLEYNYKTDRKVHSRICQYKGSSNLQQRIGGVDENNGFQSEPFKIKKNTVTSDEAAYPSLFPFERKRG